MRDVIPTTDRLCETHIASEPIRIGNLDRSFGPVDLDWRMVVSDNIETENEINQRPRMKFKDRGDVSQDINGKLLSFARSTADDTFCTGFRAERMDLFDWTKKVDQRCDVVGAHIQHRASAALIKEFRTGMPGFRTIIHEEGGAADRLANGAIVDQFSGGLLRATEESVRGAADAKSLLLGSFQERFRLFPS